MGNIFDIALILTVLVTAVVCFKKGFFKLLLPFRKFAAFSLAMSLKDSAIVNKTVGKIIKSDGVRRYVHGKVTELWEEPLTDAASAEGVPLTERFNDVFGVVGEIFTNLKNFCISLYGKEFNAEAPSETPSFTEAVESFVTDAVDHVTSSVIGFFTTFLGFVLLYLLFSVGFWLVLKLLDGVFDGGLIGTVNNVIGGVIGIAYGFVVAWVISVALVMLVPVVTEISVQTVLSGKMGVTNWFYSDSFISSLFGIKLK